jgi:hypothetical protein
MGERWVRIETFPNRPWADLAWSVLDGHGVPAVVTGDDAGGHAPHIGLVTGGVALEVPPDRAEEARAILASSVLDPDDDPDEAR